MVNTEEDLELQTALIDELTSYIYGILILLFLSWVMLIVHIGLSYVFHN